MKAPGIKTKRSFELKKEKEREKFNLADKLLPDFSQLSL